MKGKVFWQLTPRGQRALEEAPAPQRSSNSEFWQEALRRGFEAAYGDEPGPPRKVDPTRERIIECTLELHSSRGIQATTWAEIADKAGVPVETIKGLFPTQDDLVRSCGEHFMESLQLPPAGRAPEVFAGASSENERIRRLVETSFGVYERGGDGIAVGRRERSDVPVADEWLAELDNSLDALVVESLRPLSPDSSSVVSLRALTDLEVWRTLRDQGATPEAAVDQASAAVERWLEARPAR
jgi:AcrR family transcriptional regulator